LPRNENEPDRSVQRWGHGHSHHDYGFGVEGAARSNASVIGTNVANFFAYVLSFVIIAIYWINHHHLIHLVIRVDSLILWANVNLLFWISLIPWVTVYLGDNHALPFPVALYAAVSIAGAVSFFLLRASIARHNHEPEFTRLNKKMARKNLIAILIYVAAIPVAFIYTPLPWC
jgi:uncharacterized membrane protein